MKATEAILKKLIPSNPQQISEELFHKFIDEAEAKNKLIQILRPPFNKIHQGKYRRFVDAGNKVFALLDEFNDNDREAFLTVENYGELYRRIDAKSDDIGGGEYFLTWMYRNNKWTIELIVHADSDEDEFDLERNIN